MAEAFAVGADRAAVHFDELLVEGETYAQPRFNLRYAHFGLGKQIEYARERLRLDPDAWIPDAYCDETVVDHSLQRNAARARGELDRIREHVCQRLHHAGVVRHQRRILRQA